MTQPPSAFDLSAKRSWLLRGLPWFILASGVLLVLVSWHDMRDKTIKQQQIEFNLLFDRLTLSIENQLKANEQVLRGVVGLFDASGNVDRNEFRAYVAALKLEELHPGILGVGFSKLIDPKDLVKHVKSMRAEGFPDYSINPPGQREIYTSITFLEPFNWRNQRAFGYDMYSEPIRQKAMVRARDTGLAALSGKVTLVQEVEKDMQAGVLLYMPIYQHNAKGEGNSLIGWAYSPLRMKDLMIRLMDREHPDFAGRIEIAIHDGAVSEPASLLFESLSASDGLKRFHLTRQIALAGQIWTVSANALPGFVDKGVTRENAILIAGLIVTILLASLVATFSRGHARMRASAPLLRQFKAIVDSSSDAIISKMLDGTITSWNHGAESIFGYRAEEVIGQSIQILIPLAYHNEQLEILARILRGERVEPFETVRKHKDGRLIDISATISPLMDNNGKVVGSSKIARDITERKQADLKLQMAANVFRYAREGITITDTAAKILEVNDTFTHITGYSREEALGQNPRILQSGRHTPEFYAAMWDALRRQGYWSGEIWNRRKSGEVYAELITISAVQDAAGKTQNYLGLFTDITQMKEHQQQLEHLAHYDPLTGLPNRVLLADRVQQIMIQNERRGQSLAIVYLDLDGFKAVNDTYGHQVGDELLIEISRRMKEALRDGDTLARIGGDEFVVVLVDLIKMSDYEPVLIRLLQMVSEPVVVGNAALQVSASIGITLYPHDNADADQLMRHADQAMYVAKQAGKNRYHLFDVEHDTALQNQQMIIEQIRQALEQGEFLLYYQPKVNMRTGEVIGAEALIRWRHSQRGLLLPGDFLSMIENLTISEQLDEWVIDTALAQISHWRSQGLDISVSVNIGARQLQQSNFLDRLKALLSAHPDVQPEQLELEILETNALDDIAQVSKLMYACREMNLHFALDDFGTGYSSLTYLRHLPADTLKIDQSFVRDMLDDPEDLAIVQGVVGLAKAFGRTVIAEGVETIAHYELLMSIGCELAQGYAIARPMPAHEMPEWVINWQQNAKDWKS